MDDQTGSKKPPKRPPRKQRKKRPGPQEIISGKVLQFMGNAEKEAQERSKDLTERGNIRIKIIDRLIFSQLEDISMERLQCILAILDAGKEPIKCQK